MSEHPPQIASALLADRELYRAVATQVEVTDKMLTVDLRDGRSVSVPLRWYPRLRHANPRERANFQIGGLGIHWPDLDEDISIRGLLLGRKSGESRKVFRWWLKQHANGRPLTLEDYFNQKHGKTNEKRTRKRRV